MLKGPRESGEISEQEQDGPGHRPVERAATAPGWVGAGQSYLTVHNGLLLLQLYLLLPCLGTLESLKDWPLGEATLLLQWRFTVWGQDHGR